MIDIEIQSREKLIRYINTWHTDAHIPLISEWAAQNRYLPAGTTEFPGLIDHSIAPYLVEIQDACHPDNDVKSITIKKGTQTGATTSIENVIGVTSTTPAASATIVVQACTRSSVGANSGALGGIGSL